MLYKISRFPKPDIITPRPAFFNGHKQMVINNQDHLMHQASEVKIAPD